MAARGRVAYRVSLARGVLALALGAAMVVQPEKTSDNLATYMGAFWALTGVVSIRAALSGHQDALRAPRQAWPSLKARARP